jgi:triacylglycerol lipase
MKAKNIVFVHGLFGWGPGELGGLRYWGDALAQFAPRFAVHEAKCGALSSFHDRACELFAQIAGTRVDYGDAHSREADHARFSRTYAGRGILPVPGWSKDDPVILIGHSAGAQTCMQLQQLLADDFWGLGTSADWVEAIVSVSGVINGSLLTYKFGCDKSTGRLKRIPSVLIGEALDLLSTLSNLAPNFFDLYLDQWVGDPAQRRADLLKRLDESVFLEGKDNLAYDLSLQGCLDANRKFKTEDSSYYLSIVTRATHQESFLNLPQMKKKQRPDPSIIFFLKSGAKYQGYEIDFASPPIEGWGSGDLAISKWRENDGAVSCISQQYPLAAPPERVGGEGIFARAGGIDRGKWYFERVDDTLGRGFDHFDPVVGSWLKPSDMTLREDQRRLYRKLATLFIQLP